MATSSIFTKVNPKDKIRIRKLVNALERSQAQKPADVQMSRSVSDFTAEQIQSIFGENDEGLQNRESR